MNGLDSWYEPISIIEHSGQITESGNSRGHYICDVKDSKSKHWFRTNDSKIPKLLDTENLSKLAYVVLLKKK